LPVATVFHGYDVSRYLHEPRGNEYEALRRSGDYFLTVSGFWAAKLLSLGFPLDKISVRHMGIDFRNFNGVRPGGHEGTIRVLSVGRFVEKKGFDFGIRAVSKLIAEGHDIDYLIAGDGPLADRLMRLVSTHHSGIPELVQHGVTGWLADEGRVTSLTETLRLAFASRTEWDRVRANARAKIEAEFNWERLAADLVELLCPRLTPPSTPPTVDQISPPASATASAVAMSAHPPQS
jgi:glycosyltransferase involved in cell wall biosynthesis